MRLEQVRAGRFSIDLTAHELSVLLAGARMSLSLMDADPQPTTERAHAELVRVLADFDAAFARTRDDPAQPPA